MTDLLDNALTSAAGGDPAAMRAIYDTLAPMVFGYLRARGAQEAEDLTSEVFLAVLPRLTTVTGGGAGLRTLVFSVAHARLVDELRRRSRREPSAAYDPQLDPRLSPSAEESALDSLGDQRVHTLLSGLVPDQRDVLLLRVVADLTVEQVAVALSKTPGAVKQLQRRGLEALRRSGVQAQDPAQTPVAPPRPRCGQEGVPL